jgi:peptidoglycan L-alanyl-D-glutamate endopeptidase CwlK
MRKWGKKSQKVYDELDPRLQRVCDRILHEVADVSLIDGFREEVRQNHYYVTNRSSVQWPNSKHNKQPSLAVDLQPYPMPQRKEKLWAALAYIAGRAIQIGIEEGVIIRWGGDWNQDGDLTNQKFDDLFHLEIMETPDAKERSAAAVTSRSARAFRLND